MKVLILGSEGTVGRSVSKIFINKGHEVIRWDIKLSSDHDLRKEGCLDTILQNTDFVVFLAFDVGGAKYDVNSYTYTDDNILLLHNTFSSIKKFNKPFIHSTSTMSNMNHNSYAVLKRIGEIYTTMLNGINVKLWNVYGSEEIGIKSHVIPDFINQAINTDTISIRSNGLEERMFLYCDDFSNALYAIFENYEYIDKKSIVDISSNTWTSILDIARVIKKIMSDDYNKDINIVTTDINMDSHNKRNEPDLSIVSKYWKESTSIESGIRLMFPPK
jgi:nucleoside-diphosphate-sugar epimerase